MDGREDIDENFESRVVLRFLFVIVVVDEAIEFDLVLVLEVEVLDLRKISLLKT